MPFGSRFGKPGQWWRERSTLERILIIGSLIAIIVIIILLAAPHDRPQPEENTCHTPGCIKESALILNNVNPKVKACDDFFNFTCAKVLTNKDAEELINPVMLGKELFLEICKEPIQDSEHKTVKAAKKLFQACMNEEQIKRDQVKVIKEVIKNVGGWPLLEGDSWDEINFDWIKTTYKFRELGYNHAIFLKLFPVPDPEIKNKTILKVSTPLASDLRFFNLGQVWIMQDVVEMFDVEDDKGNLDSELIAVRTFSNELQKYSSAFYDYHKGFKKFTVEEYQKKCKNIQWLEFINNIIGPTVKFSKDDVALFIPPDDLTKWLELISKTPKRTVANYIIWKLLEEAYPRAGKILIRKPYNREEFCTSEIIDRFSSVPIILMATRKHLPLERKKQFEEMAQNIKLKLVEMLNRITWMDEIDKEKILTKLKSLELMIAISENYFDDELLDSLDVDMIETKNEDLFSLIGQANRNQVSRMFDSLRNSSRDSRKYNMAVGFVSPDGLPFYSQSLNVLYVPLLTIKSYIFSENTPHYINYGSMGYIVGYHLFQAISNLATNPDIVWSNKTKQAFLDKKRCLENEMGGDNLPKDKLTIKKMMYQTVGEVVSYSAYEKWTETNGEELKLIAVPYTPKQLFWISVGSTVCKSIMPSRLVPLAIRNNKNFENDFNCPINSKINYLEKCKIF